MGTHPIFESDFDCLTDIGRAILGQIGSMALTTGSALRLLVISCWLIAGSTGRSVNSLNNAVNYCEESDSMECIPKDFVQYIGLPMDRNQLAPTYKIKSRKKDGGTGLSRRRVDNENLESENELSFTNNVEIQGNPKSNSYDFATFENFDPLKKVVIIIHGWAIMNSKIQDTFRSQSRDTVKMPDWVTTLQQRILEADDVNAVVFDWRGGAYHGYSQSRSNTWTAGKDLALFIKTLMNRGSSPSKIHLIGHSLGCHVAAIAAKTINAEFADQTVPSCGGKKCGKIGRISAMDPAQPMYENSPNEVHLVKEDANLLDVYHTDGSSLTFKSAGILKPIGHLDFYPNNGTDQPHCHLADSNLNPAEASVCDHIAAYQYFIQSANRNSDQLAIKCSSYGDYLNGKCARCRREGCRRVGYFLDRQWDDIDQPRKVRKRNHGKYYYQTTRTSDDDSTSYDDETIMTCAKGILIALQFSKRMIKEFETKKAGLGNKLKFILTAQNGSQYDFEHPKDMNEILKDMSKDSNERKVLRSVFPLPCSSSSFPIESLSVKVETDCDQSKNMFARFFSGACGSSSPLHIRNARIREVSPHPRTQKLLPIRRSEDENSKEIFLQPSPTAFEAALAA